MNKTTDHHSLICLDTACRALAEAKTVPEAKHVRDQAATIRIYLRQQGYCLEAQNHAAELRERAERRLGELLKDTVIARGNHSPGHSGSKPSLPQGVKAIQSWRWQLKASLPKPIFEAHVAKVKATGYELTSGSVLRMAHLHKRRSIESPPLPRNKYRCIVCDPPWQADMILREVQASQVTAYPTMTEAQLLDFPLPELAADDCHLYLWFTHRHLKLALHLVETWRFRYECQLTWVKNGGFTPIGSFMRTTEHVLFCRRGNLEILRPGLPLHFSEKRREHSRKPRAFYELVRQASPGPRIDLFSREPHDGFYQWGNETTKFAKVCVI